MLLGHYNEVIEVFI